MKIAVCGLGSGHYNKDILRKSYEVGREIAKNKIILLTGGCYGYPYEASKGAINEGGVSIAISPAKNLKEIKKKYNYPIKPFTKFEFTGLGVPGRNFPLIKKSDAVIIIGGKSGTLVELSIALHDYKPIGVLKGSGGITKLIPQLAEICTKRNKKQKIIYESNPKSLVNKLIKSI
jgi:uncharacterized protein (TIGR00725 family)